MKMNDAFVVGALLITSTFASPLGDGSEPLNFARARRSQDCQCLPLAECPALLDLAKRRKFDELKQHKRCGFENTDSKLCCPLDSGTSVVLGNREDQPLPVGGEEAGADDDIDVGADSQGEPPVDAGGKTDCLCLFMEECPVLHELALSGKFIELGKHSLCAYEKGFVKRCCPQDGAKRDTVKEMTEGQPNDSDPSLPETPADDSIGGQSAEKISETDENNDGQSDCQCLLLSECESLNKMAMEGKFDAKRVRRNVLDTYFIMF